MLLLLPSALCSRLLYAPFSTLQIAKLGAPAGGEEQSADIRRSAIRTVDAIARGVPDALSVRAFADVVVRVTSSDPGLVALYQQMTAEMK